MQGQSLHTAYTSCTIVRNIGAGISPAGTCPHIRVKEEVLVLEEGSDKLDEPAQLNSSVLVPGVHLNQ